MRTAECLLVATCDYYGYEGDQTTFPGGTPSNGETITFNRPTDHVISITDNDRSLQYGTDDRDDEDGSQTAVVCHKNGDVETAGPVQPRQRVVLSHGSNTCVMHRVHIALSNSYYYVFEDLPPLLDVGYTVTSVTTPNSTPCPSVLTEGVTCLARGTRILTPEGYRAVEVLKPGYQVVTRDRGSRPLLWVAHHVIGWPEMFARPGLAPFRVRAGAFGRGSPVRDILLSRQQRILLADEAFREDFGEAEVLAPVHTLQRALQVRAERPALGVEYFHLVLERHEIVLAEGLPVETMLLTPFSRALTRQGDAEMAAVLSGLERRGVAHQRPARPILPDLLARGLARRCGVCARALA